MIICESLGKRYGSKVALQNVSMQLDNGVYGLIGENGAGKSTLMKILVGQLEADEGQVIVDDKAPKQEKGKIGYLPQKFDFFANLTVHESMEYVGLLKGVDDKFLDKELLYWLKQCNLLSQSDNKIKRLSGGMKQRLGIAQAFLGETQYVLLDEPTVGLDPKERLAFRNMVNEIGAEKTILISTHIVEDVEATCENLIVLNKGEILYCGDTQKFIQEVKESIYSVRIPRSALADVSDKVNIISIKLYGDELEVRFAGLEETELLMKKKQEICNLEDAYFLRTGMLFKRGTEV